MVLLFAGCAYLGQRLLVPHWAWWGLGATVSCTLLLGIALLTGLPGHYRRVILGRVRDATQGLKQLRR
jgi:hypothetical protein